MKVKLQSSSKLELVKAVKDIADLGLKEAKDLVDEQEKVFGCPPNAKWCIIIDSEKTEEQIKAIAKQCDTTYTPITEEIEALAKLKRSLCANEPACNQKVEQKLQEVTDDDLGVSIHSVDEMLVGPVQVSKFGWQCKMLFTHEQATRVIAGLRDAKLNVTEKPVMHEGNKLTMLVITKTFPSGTKKKDLENFEHLIHSFIQAVYAEVSLEDMLKQAKETAIDAFNELEDYE